MIIIKRCCWGPPFPVMLDQGIHTKPSCWSRASQRYGDEFEELPGLYQDEDRSQVWCNQYLGPLFFRRHSSIWEWVVEMLRDASVPQKQGIRDWSLGSTKWATLTARWDLKVVSWKWAWILPTLGWGLAAMNLLSHGYVYILYFMSQLRGYQEYFFLCLVFNLSVDFELDSWVSFNFKLTAFSLL